jgi:hypothetical protein
MQQQSSGGTQGKSGQTSGMQGQQFHGQGIYPVSDHDYNIISALANELQGLEKFQEYMQNAGQSSKFWQDALNLKKQLAELFTHELAEHAKEGHFGSGQKRTMQ